MPVVFDDGPVGLRVPMGEPDIGPAVPSAGQTFSEAFETNTVVEAVDLLSRPSFAPVEGYNPADDDVFKGSRYERDHWYSFVGSRSPEETRAIASRIDREEKRARTIASAGWMGTVAEITSGVVDPTLLLPAGRAWGLTRAARAGRGAASTAAAGGGAMAITEGAHQAAEETRTVGQSAFAVGSGAIVSGLLGGAMGMLSRGEATQIAAALEQASREIAKAAPIARPAGAAAAIRAPLTLESALGADRALSEFSPVTRLQTNEFDAARAVVRDFSDAGLTYAENKSFIPTSEGGTVETRMKMRQAPMAEAFTQLDDLYARYWYAREDVSGLERRTAALRSEWARWRGRAGDKLTFAEFKEEVARAMRRSDDHPIPQVAEAARVFRSRVFEPPGREAVSLGLLEGLGVTTAPSYLTRVYNRGKIIAQRNQWTDRLVRYFQSNAGDDVARMSEAEVRSLVEDVTANILAEASFRVPGLSIVQGPRGPLRARVLNVPDELIEDFLENDIEKVARIYTRTMSADLELTAKFGSVDLKDQLAKLRDEYEAKIREAGDRSTADLEKSYRGAVRDIEGLRDRVRNVYRLPEDPDAISYRAAKVMMNLNYVRLLGGMTIAAVPDIARAVGKYGLASTLRDGWVPLVTSFKTTRLAMNEVKVAGAALDMALDTRAHALADLMDDFARTTKFERAVEGMSSRFGFVSLMAPWNATIKQITGVVAMSGALRAAKAVSEGRATTKQITSLAASGIDESMARRIWAQFGGEGEDAGRGLVLDGVFLPNTEEWADRTAAEALRALIVREVDSAIVTPGLERPLWMSATLGKVLGQFKSFAMSSTQRVLLAKLQQRDAAAVQGTLVMLAFGALAAKIKAELRGEDTSEWTPEKWAVEAVDASGLTGVLMEANNIAEKLTRGTVGLSAITGKQISRYQSRNALGALAGPSFDLVGDAIQVVGSASSMDWAATDTHAARKMLPFQNLFYLRHVFDVMEERYNEALGVPKKRKN